MGDTGYEGWAIVELMGHRKLAGWVTEATLAGQGFLRIDVPSREGAAASQLYSPAAVYAITPTTEGIARAVAVRFQPEPVTRWELPQIDAPAHRLTDRGDDYAVTRETGRDAADVFGGDFSTDEDEDRSSSDTGDGEVLVEARAAEALALMAEHDTSISDILGEFGA